MSKKTIFTNHLFYIFSVNLKELNVVVIFCTFIQKLFMHWANTKTWFHKQNMAEHTNITQVTCAQKIMASFVQTTQQLNICTSFTSIIIGFVMKVIIWIHICIPHVCIYLLQMFCCRRLTYVISCRTRVYLHLQNNWIIIFCILDSKQCKKLI